MEYMVYIYRIIQDCLLRKYISVDMHVIDLLTKKIPMWELIVTYDYQITIITNH